MPENTPNPAETEHALAPAPDLERRIEDWWHAHFTDPIVRCDHEVLNFIRRAVDDLKTRLT